ncbi:MAG: hypothetical protein H0U59_00620 [Gemmatimonadaceae bacterium]|nr:hypothetical protein [Gemmatimonadaceae bacterium]
MIKPVLYVGLDGPILVPSAEQHDAFLMRKITDYAKPFMHWAKEHFDVRWLAETGARDALYTARRLSLPEDAVSVASFESSKAEALNPKEDFYWIDGPLIPSEVAWLRHHQHEGRFIHVDPRVGVTSAHRDLLQQKMTRR